ncbi:UDP-N-acetylglucosamine:LPS N-acetylglucosamine transferase [Streptomyces sp. 3213]|uniref:glycosyltransferase n=1 Tax=Streptomyces sp. 3213.3 TaxID=1855348 RepID=UPI00089C66DB|nr:glycosyltransferase [Streptomyces sp. 3213.3]SEE96534.1 UDP-N-acetylglucosamine:LPS N-acetylglucosamine transferase [Streptomyces sp. 3213] [Streptomyces sp. 3213.3]
MPHLGSTVHLRALAVATLRPRQTTPPSRPSAAERIVIVSASVGAGHDGAAAELERRLVAAGLAVDRLDLLDVLPARLGRLVRDGYHRMLVRTPWLYQRIYSSTERAGGGGPVARALLRSAEGRLLRALPADTGAVVSTYPGASRVLGSLRLAGRLTVPVLTYLTDFSVHPLWVADGVDVHLALHAVPAAQARAAGAYDVRVCGPVVDPRFHPVDATERTAARTRFGLPSNAPLALLVAGSWGVGPVRQVARELRDCGAAVPVVVCGRNEELAAQLRADGIEHVHGWVDDMPGLMHAADVLVQNAGGLTSLEAFAAGLPVASYGCIPGHGLTNASALDQAGVAAWIQDPAQLKHVLAELIDGPRGLLQREAGLALFAGGGPDRVAGKDAAHHEQATGADRGPAAETVRVCRAGAGAATSITVRRTRPVRPTALRLATTTALACAVWVGAVGTAVATTDAGPGLIHAIGKSLDFDDPGDGHHELHTAHQAHAKGDRS